MIAVFGKPKTFFPAGRLPASVSNILTGITVNLPAPGGAPVQASTFEDVEDMCKNAIAETNRK